MFFHAEFELFVGIFKNIWFRINTMIHGGEFLHPNTLVSGAIESVKEYKKVHIKEEGQKKEVRDKHQTRWKPPLEGIFKVN